MNASLNPAQGDVSGDAETLDLDAAFRDSHVGDVLEGLDRELVGLAPVKSRIRDIAALLLIDRLRRDLGLSAGSPSLHMSFTGNPGTGKTTVALRMAQILHRLGYVRKGQLTAVTRDDLVGQYIGHTAPKTREVLKRTSAVQTYHSTRRITSTGRRPDRDSPWPGGQSRILLQVKENQRADLVVILAGYPDRMSTFYRSNPGMSSRIAHHIEFPDYTPDELAAIARFDAFEADAVPAEPGGGCGFSGIHRAPQRAAAFCQRALGA